MKSLSYTILTLMLIIGSHLPSLGQRKFSLSVSVAPTYSHSDAKLVVPIADPATQLPSTEVVTKAHSVGYSFGVMGRYDFSAKWSVSTGLWVTHSLSSSIDVNENGSSFTLTYPYSHPFTFAYKIPLLINYRPLTTRLSPYLSAGATGDIRSKTYAILGDGQEIPVSFGKAMVVTPLLGLGGSYRFNDRISLIVQPTIQYDVQSRPSYEYSHTYQLSLQTQLMYHF
ncbi:hypothetical protein [Spirosoma foliorum]|uniref:Outer membrane protein beta-barrel domain-containing protein n=1 Tax=Spirosoma foliorum TaxID=2710596 RepID=A0A7G5H0B4_9BACT|nr:hypothetical protein [Spirosoma foliorum]QMW04556.1 hypothetical protein H3H32_06370 [Spirosoma foliorum]